MMHGSDRVIAGELLCTLAAVLDIAVAASVPDVEADEALRLRRVARSQLDTAARLLSHLNGGKGTMGVTAAAGRGVLPVDPAAAVATF